MIEQLLFTEEKRHSTWKAC